MYEHFKESLSSNTIWTFNRQGNRFQRFRVGARLAKTIPVPIAAVAKMALINLQVEPRHTENPLPSIFEQCIASLTLPLMAAIIRPSHWLKLSHI